MCLMLTSVQLVLTSDMYQWIAVSRGIEYKYSVISAGKSESRKEISKSLPLWLSRE